jgi:hypothetical protein
VGAYEAFELRITAVERFGNDLRLRFTSQAEISYQIQSSTNLSPESWSPLPGTVPGKAGITETTLTNAIILQQQFYRVHQF